MAKPKVIATGSFNWRMNFQAEVRFAFFSERKAISGILS